MIGRRVGSWFPAILMIVAVAGVATANEPATAGKIEALEKQIESLRAQVDELKYSEQNAAVDEALESRVRELEARMTERAADGAPFTAGWKGNKVILQSADGQHMLRIGARIAIQLRWWAGDDSVSNEHNDGFITRRIRFGLQGHVYKHFKFKFEPAWDKSGAGLKTAYFEIQHFDPVNLRIGQFKPPTSLEDLQSSSNIHFPERSLVNSLINDRDTGIMFHGTIAEILTYQLAWMNGWNVRKTSGADVDDDMQVMVRLMLAPFAAMDNKWLKGLEFGGNFSWGNVRTSTTSGWPGGSLKTSAGTEYWDWGSTPRGGERTRYGVQGMWYAGPFHFMGEWQNLEQGVVTPTLAGEHVRNYTTRAWFVQVGAVLTGEDATFKGVSPANNFDPLGKGGWGAVELVLRYASVINPDDALENGVASGAESADAYAVGLNWFLNKSVKIQLMYEHVTFGAGTSGTDLQEPVAERDEDVFIMRFQLKF